MRHSKPTALMAIAVAILIALQPGYICLGDEAPPPDPAKQRARIALKTYERWSEAFFAGYVPARGVSLWSHRQMEAQIHLDSRKSQKLAAIKVHLAQMKSVETEMKQRVAAGQE